MNFFVTGNDIFKAGIDLKFITPQGSHGANFSADGQSLRQSFSIAQEIFSRVTHGKIDFVLIGLAPDVLFRDDENFSADNIDRNLNTLLEYIKLCIDNGAKPVGVIFSVGPSVRESYRKKFVTPLREILAEIQKVFDFTLIDMFDLPLTEEYFSDEMHLSSDGADVASVILTLRLHNQKIFSFEDLCRMSYKYFFIMSYFLKPDYFNTFMEKFFQSTIAELKRKNKIKVSFVTDHAAA